MAEDALATALAGYVHEKWDIPAPSNPVDGQEIIPVPTVLAAKLALYSAMRAQGITKVELASKLGISESAVRKLANPDHRSHISQVQKALRAVDFSLISVITGPSDFEKAQPGRHRQGILTAMADIVVADWGNERRLRVHENSQCAEVLDTVRSPERDEWFKGYFVNTLGILLAGIVDCAYRLDTVLAAPSPAGVSVVEYHIQRPMLEYTYRLFDLVQMEIDVSEREKRAIEHWFADYQQFKAFDPKHQTIEQSSYFDKLEPVLSDWYRQLTNRDKIKYLHPVDIFGRTEHDKKGWPTNLKGTPVNPAYLTGYSLFSAVGHGNLWAVQRYGMNDPSMLYLERNGLDDKTLLKIQAVAGTFLQLAYASVKQFVGLDVDASLMNRLGSHLALIQQLQATIDPTNDV